MAYIVKRLRDWYGLFGEVVEVAREAADEIERLEKNS